MAFLRGVQMRCCFPLSVFTGSHRQRVVPIPEHHAAVRLTAAQVSSIHALTNEARPSHEAVDAIVDLLGSIDHLDPVKAFEWINDSFQHQGADSAAYAVHVRLRTAIFRCLERLDPKSTYAGDTPDIRMTVYMGREWDAWSVAPEEQLHHPREAVRELKSCIQRKSDVLDLKSLALKSVPPLIGSLTTLEKLNLTNNQLTTVPELPVGLTDLSLSNNQLTSIPELPVGLTDLNLWNNELTTVPELPVGLTHLDLTNNQLTTVPELPAGLTYLDLANTRLTSLPELPAGLTYLSLRKNQLTTLPELPAGLRDLDLRKNRLTTVPETLLHLQSTAVVNLEDNPLTERVLQRLQRVMAEPDYSGPTIHFSMASTSSVRPVRPLSEAVADWYPEGAKPAHFFTPFNSEENADQFSAFLDGLNDTETAKHPEFGPAFKEKIAYWLWNLADPTPAMAAETAAFRATTFLIAHGATESCEDRVSLVLNNMMERFLTHRVARGTYDDKLPELIAECRKIFRVKALEEIAWAKSKTLKLVDEIDVFLAYQVKLNEALELGLPVKEMRFFRFSGVYEEDLARAEEQVKAEEKTNFETWLYTECEALKRVMQRLSPGYAAIERTFKKTYEEKYQARLAARLAKEQLPEGMMDALVPIGKQ
ncbi:MAG: NEL-type E3 ubiquitin ligase domain-containing protein, partial [Pseudomonadota bacterium]